MTLYNDVTARLDDPQVAAIVMEDELEPVQGAGTAISPPTYARSSGDPIKGPLFAVTQDAFVPVRGPGGWHHDIDRRDGVTRRASRVVVNAIPACADNAETPLYLQQHRLGIDLPAVVLDGSRVTSAALDAAFARRSGKSTRSPGLTRTQREDLARVVAGSWSSWLLAHRYADSWLQFADDGDGGQLWANPDSATRGVLAEISHDRGDLTYAHAPNAAIFGNWLSGGSARRHAIPRAYACEITGYGATPIKRAATKLDRTGGATNAGRKITRADLVIELGDSGERPSEAGFGQVPTSVADCAYQCEFILRQASLSLKALDRFAYPDDDKGAQAQTSGSR